MLPRVSDSSGTREPAAERLAVENDDSFIALADLGQVALPIITSRRPLSVAASRIELVLRSWLV